MAPGTAYDAEAPQHLDVKTSPVGSRDLGTVDDACVGPQTGPRREGHPQIAKRDKAFGEDFSFCIGK